jgi:four helix bundle protein
MFRFEELEIWRLAVDYAKDCYNISESFPQHEKFSLGDQLRRAAISISSNIAEGSVGSMLNFRRYLNIAIGSVLESVNILNFASEIHYINPERKNTMYQKAEILIKKIRSFSKSLKK